MLTTERITEIATEIADSAREEANYTGEECSYDLGHALAHTGAAEFFGVDADRETFDRAIRQIRNDLEARGVRVYF